jgi:thioredoxin 1
MGSGFLFAESANWVKSVVNTGQVVHFSNLLNYGSQTSVFNDLLQSYSIVLVDFSATWCGPCKNMKPIFSNFASSSPHVLCIEVDVDACKELAKRYGVSSMPTFIVFKNGSFAKKVTGTQTLSKLRSLVG